jgi:hypothetical protein
MAKKRIHRTGNTHLQCSQDLRWYTTLSRVLKLIEPRGKAKIVMEHGSHIDLYKANWKPLEAQSSLLSIKVTI